jgi:hypothetical protein
MRATGLAMVLVTAIYGGNVMGANEGEKRYLLNDYLLYAAKSEAEILAWARAKADYGNIERFDSARTEQFEIGGKKLLVLLASRPMATQRMIIFVYVGNDHGWSLLLLRNTNTADVNVQADLKAQQLVFRSKAGKRLLDLPVENIALTPDRTEQ